MNPTIQKQLAQVRGCPLADHELAQAAVTLAGNLLQEAKARQTRGEYAQAQKIARMMTDPAGKALTIALADQIFRSQDPARSANQLLYLLYGYGLPQYMARWERLALGLGGIVGSYMPKLVMPFITARLRQETRAVILAGEEKPLRKYLAQRTQAGTRLNLNQLGEAILGEEEAARRFQAYLNLLKRPDVEYISVKVSSICSQLNMVAFDHTVELVKAKLRDLYRLAFSHYYRSPKGKTVHKFVNLDMEEYRDLQLTVAAFRQVLDEAEFQKLSAGIVLQAYLPDSHAVQRELTSWAQQRVRQGGAPIKIRIVKGANLAMEQVEASQHDWEQAPYATKTEVDANYKRMVMYGCQPEHARAVRLGIASHNLFDIAYAMLLRAMYQVESQVEFEMLEGMANHQARVVQEIANGLLLYAPVVKQEDFPSAIAYLVRRLDENTAEQNFLHDLFALQPGTSAWDKQKGLFLAACELRDKISDQPRRTQNRATEQITFKVDEPFRNVSDTDWALPANQKWAAECLRRWTESPIDPIPLQIGGEFITTAATGEGHDPSRPDVIAYHYALADAKQVNQALNVAVAAQAAWAAKPVTERKALLIQVANEFARDRGWLIGCMALDGGKAIPEADAEISEMVDFANYYARAFDLDPSMIGCHLQPLGTVLITPPWNFPLAIPGGGCLAALMAGNTVIFKPAPEATLVGWELAQIMWQAGIPKEVLQFVPCPDNEIGRGLVTDKRVNAVILTGARSTAQLFQSWQPELRLFAETSGKNSLIITAMADHDQAIKDLVRSAFGHAGQKCSAASLAICEAEVYDNPNFLRQLRDATASLAVGSAWDTLSKVTPIIRPPGPELMRALTTLEPGESWLLHPEMVDNNPCLWSPGIKLGVKPNSFFHKTECFGPVLGLMRADDLAHAVQLANEVDFGLTGGIHSLDTREINYWREYIQVGNAYINRHITGAIVQRQPFGGWKGSVIGPGAKAGGPNYVWQMGRWHADNLPTMQAALDTTVAAALHQALSVVTETAQQELLKASAGSYAWAWQSYFSQPHDPSQLLGEANIFRYRPCQILVRATANVSIVQLAQVILAAQTCQATLTLSLLPGETLTWSWLGQITGLVIHYETEEGLISRLKEGMYERIRLIEPISMTLREVLNAVNIGVIDEAVLAHGRLELRHYLREQAISETLHRHGNIIPAPQAV